MATYNNIITIPEAAPTGAGGTQVISSLKSLADGSYTISTNGHTARTGEGLAVISYTGQIGTICEFPNAMGTYLVEISWLASGLAFGKFYLIIVGDACGIGLTVADYGDIFLAPCASSPKTYCQTQGTNLIFNDRCAWFHCPVTFHYYWLQIA